MADMHRVIYEGWTPDRYIGHLEPQLDAIMRGASYIRPFTTKKEMVEWIKDNQPYYKKSIPEVNSYFAKRYKLK